MRSRMNRSEMCKTATDLFFRSCLARVIFTANRKYTHMPHAHAHTYNYQNKISNHYFSFFSASSCLCAQALLALEAILSNISVFFFAFFPAIFFFVPFFLFWTQERFFTSFRVSLFIVGWCVSSLDLPLVSHSYTQCVRKQLNRKKRTKEKLEAER